MLRIIRPLAAEEVCHFAVDSLSNHAGWWFLLLLPHQQAPKKLPKAQLVNHFFHHLHIFFN